MEIEGINDKIYSGFWSRFAANLLDGLIFMPCLFLLLFINSFNKNIYFFTIIPHLLFTVWYHVYLPQRYGGTPGKLIAGIKIVRMDSSPIGWKESLLRYSVNIFFAALNIIMMSAAIMAADDEIYNNLNWFQRSAYLSRSIKGGGIMAGLSNIWIWSEMVVLLFNKRKRAIHDFIAGTVVLKSEYVERVRRQMEGCDDYAAL
jgi:uncharacterized RDD family membrane protein YckC